MQSNNCFLRAKNCINSLFFNGCKWSLLITAYALIAIIIVLSSETYFSEGLYAAEVAYSKNVYDFGKSKSTDTEYKNLSEEAYKENKAEINYGYTSMILDKTFFFALDTYAEKLAFKTSQENQVGVFANVNAMDSVLNDYSSLTSEESTEAFSRKVKEEPKKEVSKKESNVVKEKKKTSAKKETVKAVEAVGKKNVINLSSKDKNILLRIVEAEATGESVKGKMLVANVVLNRVNSSKFPNTVEKVVFQNNGKVYQFSPIPDGRYYKVSISKQTKEAVENVLNGQDESQGALYFMSRGKAKTKNVRWFDNKLTRLFQYGTHEFYK